MILRDITNEFIASAAEYPVVTVFGPRQSGKTTLVKMTFPDKPYFSMEYPDIRLAAATDPRGFLKDIPQGAIFDEVQRLAGDLADPFSVDRALKGTEVIFHLGALIAIPYSYMAPWQFVSTMETRSSRPAVG